MIKFIRVKERILKILIKIFQLFPFDTKTIIFASERDFCDNSWALYQYIRKKHSDYKLVWATLNKKKYNKDKQTIFIYHPYSYTIKSAWYISRAKYIFYTHGLGNEFKKRKGQIVINLWHGIAIKGTKGDKNNKNKNNPPFTYSIYLGEMNKKAQAQFLKCDEKYLIPLGYPRNDLLLDNKEEGIKNPFIPNNFSGKVVIWMPTYRKSTSKHISEDSCETRTGLPLFNDVNNLNQLNNFLSSINVFVIIKIHHLQSFNSVFKLHFSNIVFITDQDLEIRNIQLYQIIGKTDALLTDYSSISVDYLLMNRPIGFILDDLIKYEKSRGAFQFENVKEVLAGKHIYNIEQLYSFFDEISKNIDSTKHKRDAILNSMITYQDNKSCERICRFCNL